MSDEKLDLSALDPEGDGEGWHAVLDRTVRAARLVVERRRESPLVLIAEWWRPLFAAAAVLAVLLSSVLLRARDAEAGVAGLAESSPAWLSGAEPPDPALLLRALDSEMRR